ncbi:MULTISPECIES: disulfide bond formation protein B [unclassified Uliginosibacterium]|uniref:disulfide bond formation protein B n=1 Tax=unclassified Uliginosibacterium TaxID=2621521 RepID=UPI00130409B5|nr:MULTISPECIES: disulfide bond formation protein B [unclassified Uliginosibacterium]MDO6386643.1 disulfide bond formation protein B [Uliginosibacterium sp. 31-12]
MLSELIHARPRLVLLALGIFCLVSVGAAVLLGHLFALEVCAMCWFQRLAFLTAGTGFLLAAAAPRAAILTQRLGELGLLIGLASAARQSWLLLHPAEASGHCGAGLLYYLQIGNYEAFLQAGLLGGVECAENQPLLLGLYLPQWSLLAFCSIGALYLIWWLSQRRALPAR